MLTLVKGQRLNLSKQYPLTKKWRITVAWDISDPYDRNQYDVDVSVFMLNEQRKIPLEEYFIFYNQLESPDKSLIMASQMPNNAEQQITIHLPYIKDDIHEILFVVTIHDAVEKNQSFQQFRSIHMTIEDFNTNKTLFTFTEKQFYGETAFELGKIYKKDGAWRFNPVGRGYNAGLQEFLDLYYEETVEAPEATPEPVQIIEPIKLTSFDLLKKKVDIVLEKKALQKGIARVGVVLDISGSMRRLYQSGTVQSVLERLLALATRFDDDGILDVWIYDNEFTRMPSITEIDFTDYIEREILGNPSVKKFGANNEPPVMRDVLQKYFVEEKSKLPVYLIFINDGGVKKASRKHDNVPRVLIESAHQPLFWQFVGIGNGNFDVLKKLDELEGRFIDNANFFQIVDIENESDEELYNKLLNEFPFWMKEAKSKRVIH
ncbi:VWA domain-containing protein [Bacillus cihuensis]|uniref:VWA domain-containing protein n=1 Tax=Bacillus cihuensis TaxID=1208599 RepID=UPI0003FB9B88|nr:VWA domain-containing protein [Bacillus cihuensis]